MGMHRSVLAKQKGADMNNEAKISDVVEDMEHLKRLKDRTRENQQDMRKFDENHWNPD